MTKRKINAEELNWIKYITGQIDASDLTPKNAVRLQAEQNERTDIIKSGRVPLKPFPSGIVGVDEAE